MSNNHIVIKKCIRLVLCGYFKNAQDLLSSIPQSLTTDFLMSRKIYPIVLEEFPRHSNDFEEDLQRATRHAVDGNQTQGVTLLGAALYKEAVWFITYLIEVVGVDPNAICYQSRRYVNDKKNALCFALQYKHQEIIKYLLQRPDICLQARDHRNDTLMHYVVNTAHLNEYFTQKERLQRTRGLYAVLMLVIDRFSQKHLDLTTQLTAVNDKGFSPLHLYLKSNGTDQRVIQYLLSGSGMKVLNVPDKRGNRPLHFATANSDIKTVKSLLAAGATVESRGQDGQVPLHEAVLSKQFKMVQCLIQAGAKISVQDNDGNTPLYQAALFKTFKILKCLVEKEADIDVQNNRGATALHETVYSNQCGMVRYLVAKGANVNIRDKRGQTPLHYAMGQEKYHQEIVKTLIANGAFLYISDNDNNTPFNLAMATLTRETTENKDRFREFLVEITKKREGIPLDWHREWVETFQRLEHTHAGSYLKTVENHSLFCWYQKFTALTLPFEIQDQVIATLLWSCAEEQASFCTQSSLTKLAERLRIHISRQDYTDSNSDNILCRPD